jgi:hypothetical protein
MSDYHGLGYFVCESGKLVVSDPCYGREHLKEEARNLNIATILYNVRLGKFGGVVRSYQNVNKELTIWHLDTFQKTEIREVPNSFWIQYSGEGGEKKNLTICVDSGQCGFFDESKYPVSNSTGDSEDKTTFYGIACHITQETLWKAGIIGASPTTGMGVVSTSGHGDGGYTLYIRRNDKNEVVAAKLEFVDPSQDDSYGSADEDGNEDDEDEHEFDDDE